MFHLEFSIIFFLLNEARLLQNTINNLSISDSDASNQLPPQLNNQYLPIFLR